MDRALSEWEGRVVERLGSLETAGAHRVRESLPYLVVTGTCECGCASFNVRDTRFPTQPHELSHFANGVSSDGTGFVMWLGPDGRPISVDVDNEAGSVPDPESIIVSAPGP